jgi:hypothetical protein
MSASCRSVKKHFPEMLYGLSDENTRRDFKKHLDRCLACAAEYRQLEKTLGLMSQYRRPDPHADFDNRLWHGIYSGIEKEKGISFFGRFGGKWFRREPAINWRYSIALALSMLIIGLLAGRIIFPESDRTKDRPVGRENRQAVMTRAQNYLDKSQVIMLGILNHDPEDRMGLMKQRRLSSRMLREAAVLKDELKESEEKLMMHLISEMEIILLQIANLEEKYDLDSVELIRTGIEHKGLLFKINVNRVRSDFGSPDQDKDGI